jgi:hypothetical protein
LYKSVASFDEIEAVTLIGFSHNLFIVSKTRIEFFFSVLASFAATATFASAYTLPIQRKVEQSSFSEQIQHIKRQELLLPVKPSDVKTITTPTGATIRYKEPGKSGVCETTPDVNSYSG